MVLSDFLIFPYVKFSKWLKEELKDRKLTIKEIAYALEVSRETVSRWLSKDAGRATNPTSRNLLLLHEFFKIKQPVNDWLISIKAEDLPKLSQSGSLHLIEDLGKDVEVLAFPLFDALPRGAWPHVTDDSIDNGLNHRDNVDYVRIPQLTLPRSLRVHSSDYLSRTVAMVETRGSAMAPRILHGDLLLLWSGATISHDDVVVLACNSEGGELICRRAVAVLGDGLNFVAENPEYVNEIIRGETVKSGGDYAIVGRVMKILRDL